jgi:hypothetical protein
MEPSTKKSRELTLKDRLSRLTVSASVQLLGFWENSFPASLRQKNRAT